MWEVTSNDSLLFSVCGYFTLSTLISKERYRTKIPPILVVLLLGDKCFPVANDGHDGHNDSDGTTFTSAVSRRRSNASAGLMSESEKRNIYRKCVLIFSPMSGGVGSGGGWSCSQCKISTLSPSLPASPSLCLFISNFITHYLCLLAVFVFF